MICCLKKQVGILLPKNQDMLNKRIMRTRFSNFIACALILSFLTMGISPACSFAGAALMQICGSDGEVKTAPIPVEFEQFLISKDEPAQEHEQMQNECMFCYAVGAAKNVKAPAPMIVAATPAHYIDNGKGLITPQGLQAKAFDQTGPPSFVV